MTLSLPNFRSLVYVGADNTDKNLKPNVASHVAFSQNLTGNTRVRLLIHTLLDNLRTLTRVHTVRDRLVCPWLIKRIHAET